MENNMENYIYSEEKINLIEEFIETLKQRIQEKILVVDRFEGDFAVCEDRENCKIMNILKSELPNNVIEGDVLRFQNNQYKIDESEKRNIEDRIKQKLENLFEED